VKEGKRTNRRPGRATGLSDREAAGGTDSGVELPRQEQFYRVAKRHGNVPVDKIPLGCDPDKQYKVPYPRVDLPLQEANRVSFGYPKLKPNRLFWGDNLHIMRQLPSRSIDLIYLDPPFFSGAEYNVIFGDQNEVRSFSDIWEGGMPSYLIWLNARLLEMKRLLRPDGSIYVHLDWHASHYVKVEMDKMFGYENFRREVVWDISVLSGFKTVATNWSSRVIIHGYKQRTPLFVGPARQSARVTKDEVLRFSQEVASLGLSEGIMIGWSFAKSARLATEKLRSISNADITLIKISLLKIDSEEFRGHVTKLHDKYRSLLVFTIPPEVTINCRRKDTMTYAFDASESVALNAGARIINVQWDFDYSGRFVPTQGFAYGTRGSAGDMEPMFSVEYKFRQRGKTTIACRVQDDLGGEKIQTKEIYIA